MNSLQSHQPTLSLPYKTPTDVKVHNYLDGLVATPSVLSQNTFVTAVSTQPKFGTTIQDILPTGKVIIELTTEDLKFYDMLVNNYVWTILDWQPTSVFQVGKSGLPKIHAEIIRLASKHQKLQRYIDRLHEKEQVRMQQWQQACTTKQTQALNHCWLRSAADAWALKLARLQAEAAAFTGGPLVEFQDIHLNGKIWRQGVELTDNEFFERITVTKHGRWLRSSGT